MKKTVALLLALMMSCMLIPVMAEDSITGEWYASFMGVAITLTVNEDGSFQMALPGQDPTVGTWTLEGDQFTMTADDTPVVGTVTAEGITASDGGMELFFTREPIAEITVSEVKAAETVEEFYGDWAVTYMEADGIILDPAAAGMPFPQMKIGEGVFGKFSQFMQDVGILDNDKMIGLVVAAAGSVSTRFDNFFQLVPLHWSRSITARASACQNCFHRFHADNSFQI